MRFVPLAIVTAIGLATPAAAEVGSETVSRHVCYRDLDNASPDGLARPKRRVKAAVRRACAKASRGALDGYTSEAACRGDGQLLACREAERHRRRSPALLALRRG